MSYQRLNLAKAHSIIGIGNEKILDELLLEKNIFEISSKTSVEKFLKSFPFSKEEKENIDKRLNIIDLPRTEDYIIRNHIKILTILDSDYPSSLRNIFAPPKILYVKGNIRETFKIAIVGPRKPSVYAREVTRKIARDLSRSSITIVSGMAAGIDKVAHEESCESQTGTIGVLGTGIDVVYPLENKDLYKKIVENPNNALISEFPIGLSPAKYTFPRRNRIISGISDGVLVSEGGIKSGSLITAKHAYEQGKTIYAIPGMVTNPLSKGVHHLIKDGAVLAEAASDILEDLYPMLKIQADHKKFLNLTDIELSIVGKLQVDPQSLEEILSFTDKSTAEIVKSISKLEIKGIIKKEFNNKYLVII